MRCNAALLLALLLAAPALQAQGVVPLTPPSRSATASAPMPADADAAAANPARANVTARPRIGLVLSGGGARGLAHVGVLKVLEQMQIPIDVIAGTSMGAIVGGLYASGMRAADLDRELRAVRWSEVFANRVERQQLSQRRKEEDFETSGLFELGLRNAELVVPSSAVSSRGLESLLRRYTLPVRGVDRFDQLPIPFRAVATDMETGAAVVLDHGDLALALRSSMSVPGVFAPTEVDGRVLGDGGLVNNVPIDVARALGADIVIVVNIGTPLAGREALRSVLGLTGQMINLLTEQNVQRSLATLKPDDVLIAPVLGSLTSGDFDQTAAFFSLGESGARGRSDRLAALAVDSATYAAWRTGHPAPPAAQARLAAVKIAGAGYSNPDRLLSMLENKPGDVFEIERAERDAKRLAAGGDYTRSDYQLVATPEGEALVFELEEKPWGPNYLTVGLDMSTDFRGRSAFNLKLHHNRHWLSASGTEWRNRLQIGEVPQVFTELYHPLAWAASRADDWFASGYAGAERKRILRYTADGSEELGSYLRNQAELGLDIGQPWGDLGELRLGWSRLLLRTDSQFTAAMINGSLQTRAGWSEDALRARAVVDQLDFAVFPQSGYRGVATAYVGQRGGDLAGNFHRIETEGSLVKTWHGNTLELYARVQTAGQDANVKVERYTLGGFQQLSGYQRDQLLGNHVLLLRLGAYRRLSQTPALTRGFFIGGTLEAGNAWTRNSDIDLHKLRTGMSLYLGADTGIGSLYLALTYAPQGRAGVTLMLGRP
jgi:NTE family protein